MKTTPPETAKAAMKPLNESSIPSLSLSLSMGIICNYLIYKDFGLHFRRMFRCKWEREEKKICWSLGDKIKELINQPCFLEVTFYFIL